MHYILHIHNRKKDNYITSRQKWLYIILIGICLLWVLSACLCRPASSGRLPHHKSSPRSLSKAFQNFLHPTKTNQTIKCTIPQISPLQTPIFNIYMYIKKYHQFEIEGQRKNDTIYFFPHKITGVQCAPPSPFNNRFLCEDIWPLLWWTGRGHWQFCPSSRTHTPLLHSWHHTSLSLVCPASSSHPEDTKQTLVDQVFHH